MLQKSAWIAVGLLAVGALCLTAGVRKITPNKLSPATSTNMTLEGHEILIEYSAPSARGRKVEGGLIPYGKVWRTGADAATTLSAGADLMIGDLKVPKGVYTIYTAASEDGWKLVINKETGQWGTKYDESQDLGRVPLELTPLSSPVEKFKMTLTETGPKAGMLKLAWGKTEASVPVRLAD